MILERIKQFFQKLFGINKIKYIEAPKIEGNEVDIEYTEEKNINNFKEEIKLENTEEYRISNLQKEFKEGKIKAEEISEEDTDLLINMYFKQITQKLKRINEYETKMGLSIKK
jgi:hypothetical protein